MTKWLACAVAILFLLGITSASCTISPTSWAISQYAGSSTLQTFVLSSTENVTATLYAAGAHPSWFSYPSSVSVVVNTTQNTTTFNISASIPANTSAENFSSYILGVGGSCTFSMNISGENKGSQQPQFAYSLTRYATKGDQITVSPFSIKLQLTDVQSDFIQFDEYLGSNKRQSGVILELGDVYDDEDDAYHLTLVKTYSVSGMAKLNFKSDEQITVQVSTGASGLCKLQPDWNSLAFEVKQGDKTQASVSLRNMCDKVIALQSLQIVPIGSKMFSMPNKGTKDIQPDEIFPVALVVDTTDAEVGSYSATLRASGYLPDGKLIETTVPITADVTEGAVPLASGGTSSFSIPDTLKIGEDGVLSATNVPCRDCVKVDFTPSDGSKCDLSTVSFKNSIWSVKCKFADVQIYTIKMSVVSSNGLPTGQTASKDVFVGISDVKLHIIADPALKVGTKSIITVQETYRNRPVNATLTLDNLPIPSEFTPTEAKNASLCASKYPYISSCETFQIVPSRTVGSIQITPQYPFSTDDIIVGIFDDMGNAINGTLTLDGTTIKSPFNASAGVHKLDVSTSYGTGEQSFTVYGATTITSPSSAKVGTVIKIEFAPSSPYSIFYKANSGANEQSILQGSPTTSIEFNLTDAGIYRVEAGSNSKEITSENLNIFDILAINTGMNGDTFGIPTWLLYAVFGFIALVIILFWVVPALSNRGGGGYTAPSMGSGIQANKPF